MKIHRIALSNVRGIEHLDLDEIPDTGFILITGPNEQGKSTVMDAVYTALFHKHTANNRDVKALQPIGKDVGSTIIVDATIGPYTLSVTKTFNKQRSAHLAITRPKVDNYTGADAERVLAEILEQHLDRSLFTALFVRQGELSHSLKAAGIPTLSSVLSGTDVADSAAQPTDNTALLDRVDEEYRRYYTLGKGAATGELKAAMDDVEQLTAEMHTAEQRVQDLAIYVDRVAALAEQKAAAEQRIPQGVGRDQPPGLCEWNAELLLQQGQQGSDEEGVGSDDEESEERQRPHGGFADGSLVGGHDHSFLFDVHRSKNCPVGERESSPAGVVPGRGSWLNRPARSVRSDATGFQ